MQEISPRFSAEIQVSLLAVCERLATYPRPLTLATEHLLLGLAAAGHEVSAWLRQQGLESDALEAEIHQLYGYQPGPLPLETSAEAQAGEDSLSLGEMVGVRGRQQPDANHPHPNPLPEGEGIGVLRALDAAANRAREGLRAVEDFARFMLDDRHLTEQCKRLRHDLTAVASRLSSRHRLAARETQADVGTTLTPPSETHRADMADLLAANFARLQESLRSLEEFGKLRDPAWAAELKQLRYRSYTLHRAVEITRDSLRRLADARLYVLVDGRATAEEFERLVRPLIAVGVHVIQLRDKRLDDRRLLERARMLRELTRGSGTLFIINDRADLAALSRADGVHVGQEELAVKDARTVVGPDALIGVSTHWLDQARQAVLDGANYIGVGPTFPSGTKQFAELPGVGLLRAVAAEVRLPAFAIGGITASNLPEVLATGFTRVAVSGAVTTAPDPAATARELLGMLLPGKR
jgi:thiamine-phosphate pyrophosphorylase